MTRGELLPLAHLALSAIFVGWNIVVGGRIARQRSLPGLLTGLSALVGLLVAPALLVFVASTSMMTGRSLQTIAWVWPVTTALVAAQALYATATRRVSALAGVPILVYDAIVATAALAQYFALAGEPAPRVLLSLVSGTTAAQAAIATPAAALSPLHTPIPLLAPAHPARWRTVAWWRGAIAAFALAWSALTLVGLPDASRALWGFDRFAAADLRPRTGGPFAIGLEILPTIGGVPHSSVVRNDLALIGEAEITAVLVAIDPRSASTLALDSVRRVLEPLRRDSLLLVVALRAPRGVLDGTTAAEESTYIGAVDRVARRLRPDYLLPLDGRGGATPAPGSAAELERLDRLLRAAAVTAKRASPGMRIAVSIVPGTVDDSILYAWAASSGSPVDAVGFTFLAGPGGATRLEAELGAAERWMRRADRDREHWVFRAGGLPGVHGDEAQERATAGILGWAMPRPGIRGAIVTHAGDYGTGRGLRAVSGRVRPAFAVVVRAARETRRQ
jgi:hypothetical protein